MSFDILEYELLEVRKNILFVFGSPTSSISEPET
jgi:hypothetical protein